jgi:hypothetical protein
MKVTHKDDINALSYYQNYNKVMDIDNKIPNTFKNIQKHISCQFPIVSDLNTQSNIGSSFSKAGDGTLNKFQKMFSYLFYGNSDALKLKEV